MTDTLTGIFGPVILDGYLLDRAAEYARDVVWTPTSEVTRLLPGGRAREAMRYHGAGYPLNGGWYEVTLHYQNLRGLLDLADDLLSAPGLHSLVFWQRHTLVYAGDGSRAAFYLPWVPAVNDAAGLGPWNVPPSMAVPAAAFATEVKVGVGGRDANGVALTSTAYTVVKKTAALYAAGTPAAGAVWFLEDGSQFKFGTAPLAGDRVFVRLVPILPVYRQGRVETKQTAPTVTRTPRDIVLVEA